MLAHALVFYFFGFIAVLSSVMVISSKNTVHAVFFLILNFVSISCLFIMIGAEFIGMITLIVYVGAVAVLFLFVVMMLNINFKDLRSSFLNYLPFGALFGAIFFGMLVTMLSTWKYKSDFIKTIDIKIIPNVTNTKAIGNVMYTDYVHYFQISGLILLVAMIGAILLTFRRKENLKRQDITKQVSRERADSVQLIEVESFKGVNLND
jgi:NADH-quinone oxidoreductase subunit J